jgi:ABC-type multidrug transport system ATPase subunit
VNIVVERLQKRYGLRRQVLGGIDLRVGPGMFGILGPNGSGKTTLLRIVATRILATRGHVHIGPYDLGRAAGRQAARARLGYVPQHVHVYEELTGREFMEYIGLLKGHHPETSRRESAADLLDCFGLASVADHKVASYSTGMKRRLCVAQALLGDPDVLIMDEPTVGLDPEERVRLRTLLAGYAMTRTILLATNLAEDVSEVCSEVAVLHQGVLAFVGTPRDLAEIARGYTWEVTGDALYAPPAALQVVGMRAIRDALIYRLVGPMPPGIDARATLPTVRDGYIKLVQCG